MLGSFRTDTRKRTSTTGQLYCSWELEGEHSRERTTSVADNCEIEIPTPQGFVMSRTYKRTNSSKRIMIGRKNSDSILSGSEKQRNWVNSARPIKSPRNEIPKPPPPPLPPSKPISYVPPKSESFPKIPLRTDLGEEPPPSPPPEPVILPASDNGPVNSDTESNAEKRSFTMVSSTKNENFRHPSTEQMIGLTEGSSFYLLTKKGKLQRVWLEMSTPGCFSVKESENGKTKETIHFKDIVSIQRGHKSPNLVQYKNIVGSEALCLSILAKDIFDFVAENEDLRQFWFDAMKVTVDIFKQLQP